MWDWSTDKMAVICLSGEIWFLFGEDISNLSYKLEVAVYLGVILSKCYKLSSHLMKLLVIKALEVFSLFVCKAAKFDVLIGFTGYAYLLLFNYERLEHLSPRDLRPVFDDIIDGSEFSLSGDYFFWGDLCLNGQYYLSGDFYFRGDLCFRGDFCLIGDFIFVGEFKLIWDFFSFWFKDYLFAEDM